MKNQRGISLVFIILLIIILVLFVILGIVLALRYKSQNKEIENPKTENTDFGQYKILNGKKILYNKSEWEEKELEDYMKKYKVLSKKDSDLVFAFQTYEDFSKEYSLKNEQDRNDLYKDLFSNTKEEVKKSQDFMLLKNDLYYVFAQKYDTLFKTYERYYLVINPDTNIAYLFLISAESEDVLVNSEESIVELLETIE